MRGEAEEHPLETATREQFDVLLALHLCDFSWEAWTDRKQLLWP